MRLITIIILPLLLMAACQSTPKSDQSDNESLVESAAPPTNFKEALKLKTLDGAPIDLSTYGSKVLILNLWATWCGPCIKEMPDLEEMEAELGDDFVLLLASDEGAAKINKFKEKRGFDLDFVQIDNSLESLGVYSLPTTFIVGTDGELVDTLIGAREWTAANQITAIKSYLP
ncbi:MAG: TlpA disulfide reductase family protein [Cyclobacteriaceae bacterium]